MVYKSIRGTKCREGERRREKEEREGERRREKEREGERRREKEREGERRREKEREGEKERRRGEVKVWGCRTTIVTNTIKKENKGRRKKETRRHTTILDNTKENSLMPCATTPHTPHPTSYILNPL
jgi:hypothetical protein